MTLLAQEGYIAPYEEQKVATESNQA